ncbi:MAG: proteobacterial dedicated sortase system response regulator [Pseudomonadales bacterium]|nr:proteobacterial dedicated sortase system response regulator [Pseudomonadales bacterium]
MTYKIAIVEDEPAIRENYADVLRKQGYEVCTCANRYEAEAALADALPDLAIIDIGLEDEIDGGFALCQWLRQRSATLPIIFLSARDSDFDIVSGLRMGADDYLTKDISLPHLVARIAALFRRLEAINSSEPSTDVIRQGKLEVDSQRIVCKWNGTPVDLTLTEFWMVHALAKHPGHVKSRDQLMQDSRIVVDDATITSHIKRIRRKFQQAEPEFDCIETVYGMGYRWMEHKQMS